MTEDRSQSVHTLTGAYAVDAVEASERDLFEVHMRDCVDCTHEVAGLRAAATSLAALRPVAPPASLRASVLAAVAVTRQLPPLTESASPSAEPSGDAGDLPGPSDSSEVVDLAAQARTRRRSRVARVLAPLLVAAAVAVGIAWHPWSPDGPTRPTTVAEQVIAAPDVRSSRVEVAGGGEATVYVSRSVGRVAVVAERVPPPPSGKTYQLWFENAAGSMVPAGFMSENGPVALGVGPPDAKAVGMTLEPAGGSPAPTTAPLLLAPLAPA